MVRRRHRPPQRRTGAHPCAENLGQYVVSDHLSASQPRLGARTSSSHTASGARPRCATVFITWNRSVRRPRGRPCSGGVGARSTARAGRSRPESGRSADLAPATAGTGWPAGRWEGGHGCSKVCGGELREAMFIWHGAGSAVRGSSRAQCAPVYSTVGRTQVHRAPGAAASNYYGVGPDISLPGEGFAPSTTATNGAASSSQAWSRSSGCWPGTGSTAVPSGPALDPVAPNMASKSRPTDAVERVGRADRGVTRVRHRRRTPPGRALTQ